MQSAEDLIHAPSLAGLSNHDLIARLKSWAAKERRVTLGVLFLLNEVERRRLHLDCYSSLFAYCTGRLGYSNSAAGRRIAAARCLRNFPAVVPMLLDGRLNLTTLCIFARVLTEENAADLLARGAGASQESADLLAAEFGAPKPARDRIKPVKSPQGGAFGNGQPRREGSDDHRTKSAQTHPFDPAEHSGAASSIPDSKETHGATPSTEADTDRATSQVDGQGGCSTDDDAAGSPNESRAEASTYDVKFRADGELVDKLRRAQTLLSPVQSNPSLAFVVDRALELLLDRHDPVRREARRQTRQVLRKQSDTTKNNETRTDQPRPEAEPSKEVRARKDLPDASNVGPEEVASRPTVAAKTAPDAAAMRFISRRMKDQVLLLFGMQCAFVGPEGRCPETRSLDLDHVVPLAVGGSNALTNLRPMCAGHNQRAADRVFGTEFMDRHRSRTPGAGVPPPAAEQRTPGERKFATAPRRLNVRGK